MLQNSSKGKWLALIVFALLLGISAARAAAQTIVLQGKDGVSVSVEDVVTEARKRIPQETLDVVMRNDESVGNLARQIYVRRVAADRARAQNLPPRATGVRGDTFTGADPATAEDAFSKAWWDAYSAQKMPDEDTLLAYARTRYQAMSPEELKTPARAHLIQVAVFAGEGNSAGIDRVQARAHYLRQQLLDARSRDEIVQKVQQQAPQGVEVRDIGLVALETLEPAAAQAVLALGDDMRWTQVLQAPQGRGYYILYRSELLAEGTLTFEEASPALLRSTKARLLEELYRQENARMLEGTTVNQQAIKAVQEKLGVAAE